MHEKPLYDAQRIVGIVPETTTIRPGLRRLVGMQPPVG
jgi:hypothetical protein